MSTLLETPTYLIVSRFEGDKYLSETKIGATLASVVADLEGMDDVEAVLMLEDFKIVDVSAEVAWSWWNAHHGLPNFGDRPLPSFINEHCGTAYTDWCNDSGYEAHCQHEHERSFSIGSMQ